jgi:NADH-quinone oxidoreductase subunit N
MSIEGNNDNVTNFLGYREIQSTISNEFVLFGLMIIFISIMFKLAIAPLHAWSPDVYEGSPTSSTLFFAVVSKLSLLVLLLRIFYHSFHGLVYSWKFYIVLIAVFSVMVGSFTALEQKKLKSLFAYSSTSHLGYILIAFCSGTLEGVQSIIAYIIIYMLSSSCIWSIIILLKPRDSYNNTKANKDLADVASLIKSNSILGFILSTTLFSIAGFPPLIGFFTKLNIFLSAMESYMFLVAIVSILASIISTFYYIRIIKIICFENKLVGRLYYPLPYLENKFFFDSTKYFT